MEINITKFYKKYRKPYQFFDSIARSGNDNIAMDTWNNANKCEFHFVTPENRQEFVNHFAAYGAWDDLDTCSIQELNTLFIQDISAAIIEKGDMTWKSYEKSDNAGRLFKGIDNQIYFYIGT